MTLDFAELYAKEGRKSMALQEKLSAAEAQLSAIRKMRDGYANQAKFADVEAAAYFREFVRRIDAALKL